MNAALELARTITLEQALTALSVAGFLFWVLVAIDRRRRWPEDMTLHLDAAAQDVSPGVLGELVVVVPARNEAATLPRTLPRLIKQADWIRTLIVVNDRSEDHTSSVAARLIPADHADRFRVIDAPEPPEGWSGKTHALHVGLGEATRGWPREGARQWVLFTDADILHPLKSIGRLCAQATAGDYDVVSVMARLRARSFWEALLIPPFVYFFQLLYPFRKVADSGSRVAAAAGGCLLIRRSLLDEIGGLEPIRDEVIDDLAIARKAKRSGGRIWLGLDPDMISIRTYHGLREIVDMVARTAFAQLGYHYLMVPVVWVGLAVGFIAPAVVAIWGTVLLEPIIAAPAWIAWILSAVHFSPVLRHERVSPAYAMVLPIAALLYGYMTTVSAWRRLIRRPTRWRDTTEVDATNV